MTVLLTGASGFVGRAILKAAQLRGIKIRPVYRSHEQVRAGCHDVLISHLDNKVDWIESLYGIEVVVHAAALTHVMWNNNQNLLPEYRRVNVEGTINLARQAAACGVKRFVFISSIKVNGDATPLGQPFTSDDLPAPVDAYGLSKSEAERQLMILAKETGIEVTIIRPPLIYGPGVKGNFASLLKWVRRGIPIPLGCVTHNRRSLVGIDNLVELILICLNHPNAANQIFLVSDGEDLSTSDLLRRIGGAMGRSSRLIFIPVWIITTVASLMGKTTISNRLMGTLQVDNQKTCDLLNWRPHVSVDDGLRRAVE